MKPCSRCKRSLPLKQFVAAGNTRSGRGALCTQCNRDRNNRRNRALRVRVLNHYSGGLAQCSCCGVGILEFLSLDHINGGGRRHRRTIKIRWWEWLIKNGLPLGFRVLCHNCNQSIGLYGYCPHQTGEHALLDAFESYDPHAPSKSLKLTSEQVQEIRKAIANGVPQIALATKYRVSRATICLINGRRRWGDA